MISIENVTFGYRMCSPVLQGFSLRIEGGGFYGLLGKNGTGKSTLLYLMTGLLRPQYGQVMVDGRNPFDRNPEGMSEMFLVPEEYELPAIPLGRYVQVLRPFYPRFDEGLLQRCLSVFEMDIHLDMGQLSMGQKKKVYISLALAANTRYLLMDEPTNGLDILSKSQFRKAVIEGMNEEKTVIVSTHQVHDVEHLLDHVVIIDRNRVLRSEPLIEEESPVDLETLFIETVGK